MGVKPETYLQQNIQRLITKRGGYIVKQHGSMITEPGIPDLLCCYRSLFIAIEAKIKGNTPSKQQGVHCRAIQEAGGITIIAYSVEDVSKLLDLIDEYSEGLIRDGFLHYDIMKLNIDDGTGW